MNQHLRRQMKIRKKGLQGGRKLKQLSRTDTGWKEISKVQGEENKYAVFFNLEHSGKVLHRNITDAILPLQYYKKNQGWL